MLCFILNDGRNYSNFIFQIVAYGCFFQNKCLTINICVNLLLEKIQTMRKIVFLLMTLVLFSQCKTVEKRFDKEVKELKARDAQLSTKKGIILFIGSSTFTRWTDVQKDMDNPKIVNRAFGGSTLEDVYNHRKAVAFDYEPKQIVIYCGENDIAYSSEVTPQEVEKRFEKLFTALRNHFPTVPIVYLSMKPCPSRWEMKERMISGNHLIEEYLKTKSNTQFIDIWSKLLNNNQLRPELYVEDRLHLNHQGYMIIVENLKPYILK